LADEIGNGREKVAHGGCPVSPGGPMLRALRDAERMRPVHGEGGGVQYPPHRSSEGESRVIPIGIQQFNDPRAVGSVWVAGPP
jgi:hypothetical protein